MNSNFWASNFRANTIIKFQWWWYIDCWLHCMVKICHSIHASNEYIGSLYQEFDLYLFAIGRIEKRNFLFWAHDVCSEFFVRSERKTDRARVWEWRSVSKLRYTLISTLYAQRHSKKVNFNVELLRFGYVTFFVFL